MQDSDNRSFFSPLRSHYDAIDMVTTTTKAFFIIAAFQLLSALVTANPIVTVDVVINFTFAAIVRKKYSRAAAMVLLTYSLINIFIALAASMHLISVTTTGPLGIFLPLLGLWAGARAVEATYKLSGSPSTKSATHVDESAS